MARHRKCSWECCGPPWCGAARSSLLAAPQASHPMLFNVYGCTDVSVCHSSGGFRLHCRLLLLPVCSATCMSAGAFRGHARLPECLFKAGFATLQANSVPAAFWTLTLLLLPSSAPLVARIRSEAAAVATAPAQQMQLTVQVWWGSLQQMSCPKRLGLGASWSQQHLLWLQMALESRSTVRLCADEAIRLFSPSIDIRRAAIVIPPLRRFAAVSMAACRLLSRHITTRQ